MGKLLDKLNQVAASGGPRLGFAAGGDAGRGPLALVAMLADASQAADAVDRGADALIVSGKAVDVGGAVPVGTSDEAGGDFVVLTMAGALGAALQEDADAVLALGTDTSDGVLRALDALPVDAVAVDIPGSPSSLQDLLPLFRAARATAKPLLVRTPSAPDRDALTAVRDAGAAGLIVEVAKDGLDGLAALRSEIAALPPKRRRGDGAKPSPSIGLSGGER